MVITSTYPYQLSVLLITYNHEQYIRQALMSLFQQVLAGPIEVIIADDCSTDRTLAIIKEFVQVDERFKLKFLDSVTNLGITKNYERGFKHCTGEYIAVLEGDDYWINPKKLTLQLDFLKHHWECNVCAVNYFVFTEANAQFYPRLSPEKGYHHITAQELIADNVVGNFSTCMYRKSAIDALPKQLFKLCSYDWIINICLSQTSLIGFLDEPMSVYRLHTQGAWSQTSVAEKLNKQLILIPDYDKLTDYRFQQAFNQLNHQLQSRLAYNKLANQIGVVWYPLKHCLAKVSDYIPPIVILVIKLCLPPKITRLFTKILKQGSQ